MSRKPPSTVTECLPQLRLYANVMCFDNSVAEQVMADCLKHALAQVSSDPPRREVLSILLTILIRLIREGGLAYVASNLSPPLNTRGALVALPPHHREALLVIDVFGLKYREAAPICGCPIGTVKSRLNRARLAFLHLAGTDAETLQNRQATIEPRRSRSSVALLLSSPGS
jgi:RNA polymerase sigma-70 factor, ECF subfamily